MNADADDCVRWVEGRNVSSCFANSCCDCRFDSFAAADSVGYY